MPGDYVRAPAAVLRHRRAERRRRFRVARSLSARLANFRVRAFVRPFSSRRRTCFRERILLPAVRPPVPLSPGPRPPRRASGFLASDGYLIARAIHTEFEGANGNTGARVRYKLVFSGRASVLTERDWNNVFTLKETRTSQDGSCGQVRVSFFLEDLEEMGKLMLLPVIQRSKCCQIDNKLCQRELRGTTEQSIAPSRLFLREKPKSRRIRGPPIAN